MDNFEYRIEEITIDNVESALSLIWNVFNEFESSDYLEEGIKTFKDFIEYNNIKEMMEKGILRIWGCYDDEKIIGVLAAKNINHISMLFVDKEYHRKGIARKLLETLILVCKSVDKEEITVNSSPYAVSIYHKLGFADKGTEQTIDGIRFTPMKLLI